MKFPSVMQHSFSRIPSAQIERSSFNRSHGYKTTFDAGWLIPVFADEALPGDTFNLSMSGFARIATPIKPIMDNIFLDSFFFAVPIRLIWNNWQKFNGEQANPGDSTDFVVPTHTAPVGGYPIMSLSDYLSIPTGVTGFTHSALWHRAYNLIYNEWFRDQNLQQSLVVDKDDGPDTIADYVLRKRGKRHDYFTSALPWPQKGTAVSLPFALNTVAPVYTNPTVLVTGAQSSITFKESAAGAIPPSNRVLTTGNAGLIGYETAGSGSADIDGLYPDNLYADLSGVSAGTINQLREAFQIQRMYERDARGGTRYTEIVRSHFGVTSPDARLQRPEYLGGGSTPLNITPIANTSDTATSPQGNLAGFGTAVLNRHGFTKSFTEHCVLIGLICARADLTYQQGLNRMFSRSTRFDFFWPALAHLGEQAILNKEIYTQGISADNQVFGYQERYAEYRYKPSVITGKFRSADPASLDVWHLSQDFSALPVLNSSFIVEDPPIDRVIAVPAEPHFLYDSYFKLICARPMPVYSVPGMIDHF